MKLRGNRRVFWDNGFQTVAAIANADPQELVPILMQAQPNKVRVEGKSEEKYIEKLLGKARAIAESANRIWRESTRTDVRCRANSVRQRRRCNRTLTRNDDDRNDMHWGYSWGKAGSTPEGEASLSSRILYWPCFGVKT